MMEVMAMKALCRLAALLVLLALLPAAAMAEGAEPARGGFVGDARAIERAAASVVRVEIHDADGRRIGTGSGFAIGDPAVLVTACHVIVNMDYMIAWRDDGTSFRVEQVIDVDEDADVAICLLPDDAALQPLPMGADRPMRGEQMLVIASQFGLTNLVAAGNVCGMWESDDADWILFSAPVSAGCSGGPLFNDAGEVIGMVMGTYEKAQNLNLATPVDAIAPMLPAEEPARGDRREGD